MEGIGLEVHGQDILSALDVQDQEFVGHLRAVEEMTKCLHGIVSLVST